MKLRLQDTLDAVAVRRITDAVLRADLGSRVNFEPEAQIVRIENWLTVSETIEVIARNGYLIASVVDDSNTAPAFRRVGGGA
ncbi:hypothetical protein [Arenimonas oryziterrae]|uniref:HMA domain-containing protein n=1 Tax=Arenimonas oryziterrae DSM 21050 = YC6267 TaxID=1121015 RepID=A0A091ASP9_9GAMM|nr:hypothetical protein [Arenimonas oryziterrae]KFN42187.1 hypothetical protein N789_14465 [Arenimonas oryziterrae DSM 21050 = YC6267]